MWAFGGVNLCLARAFGVWCHAFAGLGAGWRVWGGRARVPEKGCFFWGVGGRSGRVAKVLQRTLALLSGANAVGGSPVMGYKKSGSVQGFTIAQRSLPARGPSDLCASEPLFCEGVVFRTVLLIWARGVKQ